MRSPNELPALESAFVGLESSKDVSFVTASILEFDRPIAVDALRRHVDAALADVPRYHQRIDRARRVWVDDETFRIENHVDVATIDGPGGREELEAFAARLLSSELPPEHSPWRLWTVRGLADGRGAVVALVHHTLVDGIAGFRLLEYVLHPGSAAAPSAPAPSKKLGTLRELVTRKNLRALVRLLVDGLRPASQVGLNPRRIGHVRAVASHTITLDSMKTIEHAFGVTNNDVVLTVVALALRRFLGRRGLDPDRLRDVRAMVPVSRHTKGEPSQTGNRVVLLLAQLPVHEADPVECLHHVAHTTRRLKADHTANGGDLLVALGDLTTPAVLLDVLRVALWMRAFNVLVTNVPGPKTQLSLLGAQLVRIVPIVNLWPHQSVGVAVASYAGTITFGIHVDRAVIANVGQLRDDLGAAFRTLLEAAGQVTLRPELGDVGSMTSGAHEFHGGR